MFVRHPQRHQMQPEPPQTLEQHSSLPDFIVAKSSEKHWEVSVSTQRGLHWISANYSDRIADESGRLRSMSLFEVNDFLRRVRRNGLRTRYCGPHRVEML